MEAVNLAANQVRGGAGSAYIAGGVEMMGRVAMGSDGAAIAADPSLALETYFVPQGISADIIATEYGFSRDEADALAVESQRRAKQAWDEDRFSKSVITVHDQNGLPILARDEYMRPQTDMQSLGGLKPAFKEMGEVMPGFDKVALMKYPHLERINHIHHAGNSSGVWRGAWAQTPRRDPRHVNTLLKVCHDNIKSLNLADNDELDDDVLDGARLCAKLKSINLAGLRLLSSAGLEALLTPVPESAVFQGLSYCNFGRLMDTTVSDSVVELLVASNPQLRYLNVQGSTVLTDSSLEALVASCPFLETLEVNYCPNITDQGMGYLVDNSHLTKLEIWGCAQLTEVFMDGYRAELEIVGAWMRPNSLPVLQ